MLSPSEISADKVAVYVRWSTDDQTEGTTLEVQLERCKHYLKSQGWSFNESLVYIDNGWSGGSLDRPALTQMRTAVKEGRVECAVVYRIDRLSRSVVDIVDLVLREWEGRCFVKSTSEDVNTISPAGKMFFYILVSFAEYERNIIRERTMGGKVKRAEQGLNPGFRPPFGYVTGGKPGTVKVVEHEAGLVQRIYEMYLRGNGSCQIAHAFNTEGLTLRGKPWNDLTVRRMLSNPAYTGILQYGKTSRAAKAQRQRHGLGQLVRFAEPRFASVENAYPVIVPRATWERVQELLRERANGHGSGTKPTYSDYLLSGLATCQCGAPINGKGVGKGHFYYYCTAAKRRGRSVCSAGYISTNDVNERIAERVKALLSTEGQRCAIKSIAHELDSRIEAVHATVGQARIGLAALTERAQRVERDYRSGDLVARLYAKEMEAVEADREAAVQRISALEGQMEELIDARSESKSIGSSFDLVEAWEQLNVPERKQLLQKLTVSIQLYRPVRSAEPPLLEITWIRLGA